ncbi:hypothetical protein [Gordonia sputi]
MPDVDNKTRPTDTDLATGQAAVGEAERAVAAAQAAQKVAQTKLDTAKPQDRAAAKAELDKANNAVTDAQTSRDLMADLPARHDNFATAPDRSELITKQAELAQARRDLTRLQAEQAAADKAAADARAQHKSPVDIATADGNATKARKAVASAESKVKELEAAVKKAQTESGTSARERRGEQGKNPLPIVAYADGSHDTEATTGPRMWALAEKQAPKRSFRSRPPNGNAHLTCGPRRASASACRHSPTADSAATRRTRPTGWPRRVGKTCSTSARVRASPPRLSPRRTRPSPKTSPPTEPDRSASATSRRSRPRRPTTSPCSRRSSPIRPRR